eukprot:TRINITY_DN440_c0_g3_i1.p1 TRINITY_DN440_c0_g3~~TRINITY_DN440_c0_g3_i1.p1  ORF type:complete len:463 (+),score=91.75 TRINITY_DN440_c0_g3_i1:39-1391(+)
MDELERPAEYWIGKSIFELRTPAFIVDKYKTQRNCSLLINKSKAAGLALRPHIKTHKTVEGARMQLGGELESVVVSTLAEARLLCQNGFQDILYGIPISPDKFPEVKILGERVKAFHLMVDNLSIVKQLENFHKEKKMEKKFSVFLAVNAGYGREGTSLGDMTFKVAHYLSTSSCFEFQGLYSHSGHAYACATDENLAAVSLEEASIMAEEAELLRKNGIPVKHVSVGSTPAALFLVRPPKAGESVSEITNKPKVTEIHAGNYLFLDCQQAIIGKELQEKEGNAPGDVERYQDILDQCGCYVLARVLSVYPDRKKLLIDAGALALSKDLARAPLIGFGHVVGYPYLVIEKITQEVGVVTTYPGVDSELINEQEFPIGSFLKIIPNHSCLTAACFPEYYVVEGGESVDDSAPSQLREDEEESKDGTEEDQKVKPPGKHEKVIEVWKPCRGW